MTMSHETVITERLFDPRDGAESIGSTPPISSPKLSGFVIGDLSSGRRGQGHEREGTKTYEIGDDVRDIDWNLTARNPEGEAPIVRTHIKEVIPTLYVATDVFRSRSELSRGLFSKQILGASVISSLLRMASSQEAPSSLIAATDKDLYVQPRPTVGRYRRAGNDIGVLTDPNFDGTKDSHLDKFAAGRIEHADLEKGESLTLADVLTRTGRLATRSVVMIVSDFRGDAFNPYDELKGWGEAMSQLKAKNNVLVAIELVQPGDFELDEKTETFSTGKKVVVIGSDKNDKIGQEKRNEYMRSAYEKQLAIDEAIKDSCSAHIQLSTDNGAWLTSLRNQLRIATKIISKNSSRR